MLEYTPTLEEIRGRYVANRVLEARTGRQVESEFDRAMAAHDAEKDRRITELEARVAAHQKLGLAAIFLADTFDADADPDVEIRKIRDEWLAAHDAQVSADITRPIRALIARRGGTDPNIINLILEALDDVDREHAPDRIEGGTSA